ncbi:hypothetical protein [Sediminitomix flava]|uniref:Uncharacterized protein n=1 Tax=Sediminitomix flava TaxID=379075 RepID=A0A315ZI08_SEDFL|nr:hypothetical protein [Sediminitomix flava]PWJ44740.1 hypothetical protein BC781_1011111 [Sediminitomix flava]
MKKIILTLSLSLISFLSIAQDFVVPKYEFKSVADYSKYEKEIVACIDWLFETPIIIDKYKRKAANKFLFQWLSGSPDVHIEINPSVITFIETSPDLLLIFMGGWAKYAIEAEGAENKLEGQKAGINAVIDFYTKNESVIKQDKNVKKLIKLKKKGKLDEFLGIDA